MFASRLALCAVSCFVLLACGDDDEGSAVKKCDDLVADICARGVECGGGGSEQECIEAAASELPCGKADAVSEAYNRCIDQVNTDSCSTLFPANQTTGQRVLAVPADCVDVILFE